MLMTRVEASRVLRISVSSLDRAIRTHIFDAAIVRIGKRVFLKTSCILSFIGKVEEKNV